MKFVCDFDGVLTDLSQEADRVMEIFALGLGTLAGLGPDQRTKLLASASHAMNDAPHRYGWYSQGRISAYCNEDGFIRVNALGALLDGWASDVGHPSEAGALREKLCASGTKSFSDLAQASYFQMVKETAEGERHPLDARTRPVLEQIVSRGDEVVIVSNSGTDRILQMFSHAGLAAGTEAGAKVRVRGNAQKFMLGDRAKSFSVGEYIVDTDRPNYEKILREERPDVVVGDVFSLDLALPTQLAREKEFSRLRAILRKRPYTPDWSLRHLTQNQRGENRNGIVDSLDGLLGLD